MAVFASSHIYKERLDICRSCEHYERRVSTCKQCGCFMLFKCKIANLRCPIDKWKEVYATDDYEPKTIEEE